MFLYLKTDIFYKKYFYKWTLGKMIQLNTGSPFQNAKDRIRKWKKINGL
jgi:Protein of unknown function (DUF1706)